MVAYVVPKDQTGATAETSLVLIEYCHLHLVKWSSPRDVEFIAEFPQTRLRKIDYRALKKLYGETRSAKN